MSFLLKVKKLFSDSIIPTRQTEDSAGYDLSSHGNYTILPNSHKLIHTGISVTVPPGTYGQIASRSGMSCKGTIVGAGVIDRDYMGHVKVLMHNLNTDNTVEISHGDRIAQLILKKIETPHVEVVDELETTERGESGFGSTGVYIYNLC